MSVGVLGRAQLVKEDVPVVHLLAFRDVTLLRIPRVVEPGVVMQPRDARRARSLDVLGKLASRRDLEHLQRADL